MRKYLYIFIVLISIFLLSNIKVENKTRIESTIKVEVKGELNNPGVFELNRGSTFNDLIKLLQLKEDSDLSSISLTDNLYNNQIIVISKKDDSINKISINSASLNQLCLLPGIGESTAKKIIEYRENNGSFNSLDELMNISGIGEKKYEKLLEYITL